jgi:beta-glucosidase
VAALDPERVESARKQDIVAQEPAAGGIAMARSRVRMVMSLALVLGTLPASAEEPSFADKVGELTVEEKAALMTGRNDWETYAVPRLGIPPAWMADGPVGLRKSTGENVTDSVPATCFPSAAAMAATWNEDLIEQLGAAIGKEARSHSVSLLLAPGLNIKRHPLGGRNFEYYSEDPLLAGRMAAAFVRGVQSQGVGATIKHFAVNNQEHRRMSIDARVGERALREIYLRGFEIAVKEGEPQAVMGAYNLVNGTGASENPRLLTEILRGEWGFEGLVVSDWGAVNDPVAAVVAGLDLEMPGNPLSPPKVAAAVMDGKLDEAVVDRMAENVLQLADRQAALGGMPAPEGLEENHDLARQVAAESIVLLQNDGLLPLEDPKQGARLAVVGRLASEPRIQGIGSSQINATKTEAAWPLLEKLGTEKGFQVTYSPAGASQKVLTDAEAGELADFLKGKDVVVVFAGQEPSHDAEAWDRPSMSLAPADLRTIEVVQASGKPFAVVLVGGASIDVGPFAEDAGAVLMGWLGGEAFGSAVAEVVFGERNPSGKLSETFAWAVEDHASDLNFPGGPLHVDYGEGIFVGYRYFFTFDQEVAYPFGHGLSYTAFEYGNAAAPETLAELEAFDVTVEVTNSGDFAGAETVQLYLRHLHPRQRRPDRELIGFDKVEIEPGATATATIRVPPRSLAYFSDVHDAWIVEPGDYELLIGSSSADLRAVLPLQVVSGDVPPVTYTADHILADIYEDPQGRAVLDFVMKQAGRGPLSLAAEDEFFAAVFRNLPFRKLKNFSRGALDDSGLAGLLMLINSGMPPEQVTAVLEQYSAAAQKAASEEGSE